MAGKAGAFYVMLGNGTVLTETDGAFTSEQLADQAASDPALIAGIANDVQQEWLENGKLTNDDLTRHFESQRNEAVEQVNPDEFPGVDDEIEIEEVDLAEAESALNEVYDPSVDYPPVVWKEATDRWNAQSDEEKTQAAADARKNYLEMEKTATEVTQQFRSAAAIGAAFGNIFWPRKSLWLFLIGLGAAFRLGSRLT
jgi:hypothetical protein